MMSDMENKDWLDDYTSLKQINPANPFTVPAGYFNELEGRIASYKNLIELKKNQVDGGFTVPENYFSELSVKIQSRITVEDALNVDDTGFIVPENYFENLSEQINSRILVEEALAESIGSFTVPQDYFNQLNKDILNKTSRRSGVVKKLFASTAFKYATAACFAVAIGGGILISQLNNPVDAHKNSFLHKELSSVPIDDIKSYLQLNEDPGETQQTVASEGATVDDAKLQDALKNYVDSVQ